MASSGTRGTQISFGSFELAASLVKANGSRDLKLERVDKHGCRLSPSGGGGTRRGVDAAAGESYAVRLAGDTLVRLPQDELDAIAEASRDRFGSMRVLECIDYRQVPTERIQGSYWLQPAQGSARGLFLLHKALADRDRVAVVQWVASSREKLGVIRPRWIRRQGGQHRALLLSELSFANDFAEPDVDVLSINEAERMFESADPVAFTRAVEAACELVDAFARQPGDPKRIDEASDTAVDARLALLERLQEEALTASLEASVAGGEVVPLDSARAAA
jgi:non-homologous end joining protein Ku